MTDKLLVLTSAGSEAEARKIAEGLVQRRLAACVNIVPRIQSVYRWQGKVEQAEEFLLLIKTSKPREEQVRAAITEWHSYELRSASQFRSRAGARNILSGLRNR